MSNWRYVNKRFDTPPEARSKRCGDQGVTIDFGMAKRVRAP